MADFDPDAYLKQKRGFDPDAYLKGKAKPASGWTHDVVTGLAKGLGGDAVGAGQIAEDVIDFFMPGSSKAVKSIPGVGEAAHAAKTWALSPAGSALEGGARIAGAALPFALAPELGFARVLGPTLGGLAESALSGGASAAAQPTESGSGESHWEAGKEGAGTAAGLGLAGKALRAGSGLAGRVGGHAATHAQVLGLSAALHAMGVPWWVVGSPWYLWRSIHHRSPLSGLASHAAQTGVSVAGRAAGSDMLPSGAGAFIGQEEGEDR